MAKSFSRVQRVLERDAIEFEEWMKGQVNTIFCSILSQNNLNFNEQSFKTYIITHEFTLGHAQKAMKTQLEAIFLAVLNSPLYVGVGSKPQHHRGSTDVI